MKTVIVHSGGLDSTVLLYQLKAGGHKLVALSFNYGQKHAVELRYAAALCAAISVPRTEMNLTTFGEALFGTSSSQTSSDIAVPEGHYADETMKSTVVPNRNMVMLAIATAHALSKGYDSVAYAAHAGDHAIYPDCRSEFVTAMGQAMQLCDWNPVQLLAPFADKTKADIVSIGHHLGVPFEQTWSCYKGGDKHCGKCGTCIERHEAFRLAGVRDETVYAS